MPDENDASGVQSDDPVFAHALAQQLMAVAREEGVSLEALRRLMKLEGGATLRRMADVARDDWTAADRSKPSGIMTVPDMSAVDLTAFVYGALRLDHIDPSYKGWDYYRGLDGSPISGRGKTFKYLCWTPPSMPGTPISPETVRKHFYDLGFRGHTAAFTWWRSISGLGGRYASIPEDNGCWRSKDHLYFPHAYFGIGYRTLSNGTSMEGPLSGDWTFVGFQELP